MIDTGYLITIAVTAAVAGWYCYRWGHADGHAAGALDGRGVSPQAGGGPGVPE